MESLDLKLSQCPKHSMPLWVTKLQIYKCTCSFFPPGLKIMMILHQFSIDKVMYLHLHMVCQYLCLPSKSTLQSKAYFTSCSKSSHYCINLILTSSSKCWLTFYHNLHFCFEFTFWSFIEQLLDSGPLIISMYLLAVISCWAAPS